MNYNDMNNKSGERKIFLPKKNRSQSVNYSDCYRQGEVDTKNTIDDGDGTEAGVTATEIRYHQQQYYTQRIHSYPSSALATDEQHYYCSIPELRVLSSAVSSVTIPTSSNHYQEMAPTVAPSTSITSPSLLSSVSSPSSSITSISYRGEPTKFAEVDLKYRHSWSEYWNCEQSIIGARASVMVYDDTQKKWVPSGTSSGLSKVQIYHHQQNNTFRVVGRKLQDHEVVINCSILKGLKYNQATATFHQWRDSKCVYGLNFSSQQDAEAFARAMMHALEVLSGRVIQASVPPPTNGNAYEEDMGYRTMTREDAAILQSQQITGNVTPSAQTPTSQSNQNIPQSPPTPQGHHRTSSSNYSAPPAPQPPPMSMPQQIYSQSGGAPGGIMPQNPPPPQQQQQQQSQYHTPQGPPVPQHHVYSSQPVNNAYTNQYQQPIYVSSSSNQSLNQQQLQQAPQPPPHQNGPIYVSSSAQGIPTSASSNSVIYASQQQSQPQQQQQQQQQQLQPQQQPQQQQLQSQPQPPVQVQQQQQPQSSVQGFGQTNGPSSTNMDSQYGGSQIPMAPPNLMPPQMGLGAGNSVPIPPSSGPILRPAPQAPPPPPAFGGGQNFSNTPPPQPPTAPPAPPAMNVGAPPPPPPPPMGGLGSKKDDSGAVDMMSSLAAQLQSAKLRRNNKTTPPPAENSGSSTSSGGSGNYGTIGRTSKGMASMMDEMAKTLARRRALTEKKEPDPAEDSQQNARQRPWEKSNTLPHKLGTGSNTTSGSTSAGGNVTGNESPRPIRKRFGSASEETILKQVNGEGLSLALSADLDSLKAEIMREMRLEIQKAKQEIIEAIKSEFNRR